MWLLNNKIWILLLLMIIVDLSINLEWQDIKCSADKEMAMPEGHVDNIGRFPWLGIVQHTFVMGGKMQYAITGAVLIHPAYAIAPAEDMSKILPQQLVNNTKLVLWRNEETKYALDIKDYILHPQYHEKVTFATIALLELITWGETGISDFIAPVLPICLPFSGSGSYNNMYAVRMTDATGQMGKEIIKMKHVEMKQCDEFYYKNQLTYEKTTPVFPLCAVAELQKQPCVWDSGVVLITRQSWGFWKLLGFGLRGPGCGLPARFLNIHDYLPWINDVVSQIPFDDWQDSYKVVLRRVSPIKLVMFKGDDARIRKRQGQCDRRERGSVMFKDTAEVLCNKNFAQGFYFAVITDLAQFSCAIVDLEVSSRTNAAVWVEHNCHRDVRGLAVGHNRPNYRKQDCFLYFKSAAFIEFRFFFSFKAILEITLYGRPEIPRIIPNPFKSTVHTTPWWPTTGLAQYTFGLNTWWPWSL